MLSHFFLRFTLLGAEWVLWLLIALSVVSVGVMIDRALDLWRGAVSPQGLAERAADALRQNGVQAALSVLKGSRGFTARMLEAGVRALSAGTGAAREKMETARLEARSRLDRGTGYLGTMGSNAPFIGLFGTVLGIIRAFNDLATSQSAGPSVVMAGIADALVATAMGLFVAIPAVVAYNVFQRRIRLLLSEAEISARVLLDPGAGGPPPTDP